MANIQAPAQEVYNALRRCGPMDKAQIFAETLLSEEDIDSALRTLQAEGSVEQRPDRGTARDVPAELHPWRLIARRAVDHMGR